MREVHIPAVADRVERAVVVSDVQVFDVTSRSRTVTDRNGVNDIPLPWAHNDYTELSDPLRARDLLPERAEEFLRRRTLVIILRPPPGGLVEDWGTFSRMQTDEAMPPKCFDSARVGQARYTTHAAFEHPPDSRPRIRPKACGIAIFRFQRS